MIVDVHTHYWDKDRHLSPEFRRNEATFQSVDAPASDGFLAITDESHLKAMEPVDKAVVLAFKAPHVGAIVPSDYVAAYVKRHPDKLIGFASVDPNDPGALEELKWAHKDLGLRGVKLSATYQNFHPQDKTKAYPLYRYCEQQALPLMLHQGATNTTLAHLDVANPVLMEQVAYDFPGLKFVIAHVGHPWTADTLVLIRKQPNAYADVAAVWYRPWQLYNALVLAMEYGVIGKILFGSDYVGHLATTPAETVKGLYALCEIGEGAKMPRIPRSVIDEIIHRDTLKLLNLD